MEGTRARSLQACTLHGSGALPPPPAGACCSVSAASVDTEQQAAAKARPSLRPSHAWWGGWWWDGMIGAGWGEVVAKLLRRQILPLFGALMLIHSERTSRLSAHTVSALLLSSRFRTHFYSPSCRLCLKSIFLFPVPVPPPFNLSLLVLSFPSCVRRRPHHRRALLRFIVRSRFMSLACWRENEEGGGKLERGRGGGVWAGEVDMCVWGRKRG